MNNKIKKLLVLTFVGSMINFLVLTPAYAYLDPGTGSYVIQVFVAFFLGAAFIMKQYWTKLKNIFKRDSEKDEYSEQ